MEIREQLRTIINGGIEENEVSQIEALKQEFSCLTPEKKAEVTGMLDEAIAGAGENAKQALQELKNSVCDSSEDSEFSFETLSEREELSELKKSFEAYFAALAEKEFSTLSPIETENVKILFWEKFLGIFSSEGSIGVFLESVQGKVENAVGTLQGIKEEEAGNKSLSEMFAEAKKLFGDFFAGNVVGENITEYLDGVFKSDIEKIKTAKQENTDISGLAQLKALLTGTSQDGEQSSTDIYSNIQSQAASLADSFKEKRELGTNLASTIESLPFDLGTTVKDFIKGILEGSPFLAFLAGLIMGPDFLNSFLSEEDNRKKESLKKLEAWSLEDNSPLKGVFSADFLKNIDIKKLDGFFSFMKSQEIDTTSDDFWKGLLTGKTENPKLQTMNTLLQTQYGENILSSTDETDGGKGFYDKLNSIEALSKKEETQKAEAALTQQAAALPPVIVPALAAAAAVTPSTPSATPESVVPQVPEISSVPEVSTPLSETPPETQTVTPSVSPATTPAETIDQTALKEQYTAFRDTALRTALSGALSLPVEVSYSGKEAELQTLEIPAPKKIDFVDGKLSLDGKNYSPKFDPFEASGYTINNLHIVGQVSLSSQGVKLTCETESLGWVGVQTREVEIKKEMLFDIISGLLKDGTYTGKIPANGDIPEIAFSLS